MIVDLPFNFSRQTMYSFLQEVISNDLEPKNDYIGLNFKELRFIEPSGITILSNLIEWFYKKGVSVAIYFPRDPREIYRAIKYLDDSFFFKRYADTFVTKNNKARTTTFPLETVTHDRSYQWLDNSFIPWLSRELKVPAMSLTDIKVCFGEIFNNIRDHSNEMTGCIFAQHYPNKKEIIISISDFGVGIPNTMRRIHPSLRDDEAILKSIEEGVTSKTVPGNRGAGLNTLIKSVCQFNGGDLHIHSNHGILNCISGKNSSSLRQNFYPGTLIEIKLRTETIIEDVNNYEEEFEW
jgi:anti-sigma regulatory factor (Ser/Thr protein kinase)